MSSLFSEFRGGISGPRINAANQNLAEITLEAWNAVRKQNEPPVLFRCGTELLRLERDPRGSPLLRRLTADRLRHNLAKWAQWYVIVDEHQVPAKPPVDVMRNMLADPDPPLPRLTRITRVPVLTNGGILLDKEGFHPQSGLYFAPSPGLKIQDIPTQPSDADIEQAKSSLLNELLVDFPFVDDASRAHALALTLLPYVREEIDGPTPLHFFESPSPGSGKGLGVHACLAPAMGVQLAFATQAKDEEEWRRRLTSLLGRLAGACIIDNVQGKLESPTLASAITAETWTDRILGRNEMIVLPVRTIWVATGNNPILSHELARRCVPICLDPGCERPWERSSFKHPRLRTWMTQHRGELVWAALTLVQAWVAADCPRLGGQVMGSFEDWSDVMGSIMAVIGVEGFLENRDRLYSSVDLEKRTWEAFLSAWWEKSGPTPAKVQDLFEIASEAGVAVAGQSDHAQKVSLGRMLSERRNQVIADYRIRDAGTRQRAVLWKLEPIQPAKVAFSQGDRRGIG